MQTEGRLFGRAPDSQGAQALDDVGGTLRVGDDALRELARLGHIRRGAAEPQKSRLAVGGDRGQRLVDLVSDGCGQLPKHRHACGVGQIRLHPLQCLLRAFAFGDVDHSDQTHRGVELLSRTSGREQNVEHASIRGIQAGFLLKGLLAAEARLESASDGLGPLLPVLAGRTEQLPRQMPNRQARHWPEQDDGCRYRRDRAGDQTGGGDACQAKG